MTRIAAALPARPRSELLFLALAGALGSTAVAAGTTSPTVARCGSSPASALPLLGASCTC
jgi:hypothetical protein